ncbi:MAG TPA: HD domain-containing phosphohydrolase [Thermoanaerobaculia bacterium]|nr:HD domain-containing phosphohydrolase [Thermoanaerobaculia bacterium]
MLAPEEEKFYQDFLSVLAQKWRPAKAAFYTLDPGGAVFRLKAQFGFTRGDRLAERLGRNDPLVNQIYEHREPTFINNVNQAGRLADTMIQAATTRLLTAPLYLDGRIMGLVDVRDKAGRVAFAHDDALEIADLLRRFAVEIRRLSDAQAGGAILREAPPEIERPLDPPLAVGPQFPSPLEKTSGFTTAQFQTSGVHRRVPASAVPDLAPPEPGALPGVVARTMRLVEETLARGGTQRIAAPPTGGLSAREAEFVHIYLPSCLNYDEVEVAAVSSFLPGAGIVTVSSRRPLDADVLPALVENLEKIFAKTAVPFAFTHDPVVRPLDAPGDGRPVRRADIAAIQSSVLDSSPEGVVLFSLLYRHGPNPDAREALRASHVVLRNVLAGARGESRFREAYRGLVNKLIEPGLLRRTALKTHSFNVGRMARKLAVQLGVAAMEVEQITVAAILHDIGLRELSYDTLYAKRTLSDEELQLLRTHPRVGAFIVEDIPWPYEIAPLIKHHHERWDGGGYPDGLRGEQIPLGSRIIHLCEAFDAMTAPTSYRAVLSDYQALDIIESKAGTQFDPELTPEFKRMVESPSD